MPSLIISKKTRELLREYFVGTSLSIIANEFDAADIVADEDYDPGLSGERRTLVERYYRTLDFSSWPGARNFLKVAENVLGELDAEVTTAAEEGMSSHAAKDLAKLTNALRRDGFEYKDGQLKPVAPHLLGAETHH